MPHYLLVSLLKILTHHRPKTSICQHIWANIPDASLSFVLNRTDINNIWTVWIILACGLQPRLAGSTFNIPTSFCSFSGFLLDVVTRYWAVETKAKRLWSKLDAMQTAWRRWATFQYSFSTVGPFKTIRAMLSLKLNSVSYKSIVLKTMPWILFLLQQLILKEIIAIFQ